MRVSWTWAPSSSLSIPSSRSPLAGPSPAASGVAFVACFALAACASSQRSEVDAQPLPLPVVRLPHGELEGSAHVRALDLQGGTEVPTDPPSAGAVALAGVAPEEAVDLDMEAEHAAEEDVLEQIESGGAKKILPILAVTGTVTYDIPVSDDERVGQWISYLMGSGRKWYEIWLSRSTRYVPIFRQILQEHGLPQDLIFLSMIESGFSPNAYSWAHAAGPWQFMPFTGRRYGLEVGFWVDERRDFVASTHAAAKYLKKLYDDFGDWNLAWAAYNAGEGRVGTAIRRAGTRDFWKLSRTRHLRRETRHYVPKLIAAAIVSKQPQRYGFENIEYLAPFKWEVVTVTTATDLKTLARACGNAALEEDIKALNPALRRAITPPRKRYDVRVPAGLGDACAAGLAAIPETERVTYRYHRVQRGDTPQSIAKRYKTTSEAVVAFNDLDPKKLHLFGELVVPIPITEDATVPVTEPADGIGRDGIYVPEGAHVIVHRVAQGDSLWKIARRYGVSLKKLRLWNGLWRGARLQVGQTIRIYTGRSRTG